MEMWYSLMQHQFSWRQDMGNILLKFQCVHNTYIFVSLVQLWGFVCFPCLGDQFKDWVPWDILHCSVCNWGEFGGVQECERQNCSNCSRCEGLSCNGWAQWWWSVWNQHYDATSQCTQGKCFSKHPLHACYTVSTSNTITTVSSGITGKLAENSVHW